MSENIVTIIEASAKEKLEIFNGKGRYFVLSILAGVFTALASVFSYAGGALVYANQNTAHLYPFAIAFPFALTLMLVVFLKAELFPGNVLFMSISLLQKKVKPLKALSLLGFCFLGNAVGCILVSLAYFSSGLVTGEVANLVIITAQTKISLSFFESFVRGLLCNVFICLAVLMSGALKTEIAKMVAIIFLINAFMISTFENSVANVVNFTLAALLSFKFSPLELLLNCSATMLGQIFGGFLFVALPIWFTKKTKASKQTASEE